MLSTNVFTNCTILEILRRFGNGPRFPVSEQISSCFFSRWITLDRFVAHHRNKSGTGLKCKLQWVSLATGACPPTCVIIKGAYRILRREHNWLICSVLFTWIESLIVLRVDTDPLFSAFDRFQTKTHWCTQLLCTQLLFCIVNDL